MKHILKSILFLGLMGCSESQDGIPRNDAGGSCNTGLNIVNGKETASYDAVGLLYNDGGSICTGTFISHNAMLTAAHCVDASIPGGGVTYIQTNSISVNEIATASGVEALRVHTLGSNSWQAVELGVIDLAIAIFPDNTAPDIIKIHDKLVADDSEVKIVGYGDTEINFDPVSEAMTEIKKRVGTNKIQYYEKAEGIYAEGPSSESSSSDNESIAAPGDSGGPVLLNGELIGVVSGGNFGRLLIDEDLVDEKGNKIDPDATVDESFGYNYYVDLFLADAKSFIESTVEAEEIDFTKSEGSSSENSESNDDPTSGAACLK